MDERFKVSVVEATANPQTVIYLALHQCYTRNNDTLSFNLSEKIAGTVAVKRLLAGGRGHFGCLEHPQITFNCVGFPHSVIAQLRTHRVGVSFAVQSFRYTSPNFLADELESIIYLRPVGQYQGRNGVYDYTEENRTNDLKLAKQCLERYYTNVMSGMPPEQARGLLPYDYRQNFIASFNARSLMHILDLRHKPDAQWEIQQLASLLVEHFLIWTPEIADWYCKNRLNKGKLAP